MDSVEVVEFTEPWCSWAWGSEPKLRLLRWRYADRLTWRRVFADLLPREGTYDPASDRVPWGAGASTAAVAAYLRRAGHHTLMPGPEGLRRIPMSSDVAGRAVIAAALQGEDVAERLLRVLRESLFIFGAPADTAPRVVTVAGTVPGLDPDRLAADLDSAEVAAAYTADRAETRRPNDYVLNLAETHDGKGNAKPDGEGGWRYVTPTLIFRGPAGEATVPGWQPWEHYEEALETALPGSTARPRPRPSPDEALQTWPLLTATELEFICGPDGASAAGVRLEVGASHAWIDKADPRHQPHR